MPAITTRRGQRRYRFGMPRIWKQTNPDDQPAGTCPKCGNPWYGGEPEHGEKCPQCGHPLEGGKPPEKR